MFLPETYATALLLTILSMICWGSWANTQKMAGKWRFELFYLDYAVGVLLFALVASFTVGSLNPKEISAMDSLSLAMWRKIGLGFAGGVVFNLANMLLVAAISIAGLSVAFPIGIGLALVIGVAWNYIVNPQGQPALLFGGSALVLAATVVNAMAYRRYAADKKAAAQAAAAEKKAAMSAGAAVTDAPAAAPVRRAAPKKPVNKATPVRGIVLSIVAGILMGTFYPLVEMGKTGDLPLASYSAALVFAVAVFLSTFPFTVFFALMPVQGDPVAITDYFKGTGKQHLLGIVGGMIWMAGALANFCASSTPPSQQVGPAVSYALGQGATMISAMWGLLVWKEFAGAGSKPKMLLMIMFVLFIVGLAAISIAPLYAK